jgi:transcriptional regulator with XRE-family HTH domain
MKFNNRLIESRKALGLTQIELADKVGVSSQVISNWERGYTEVGHNDIIKLSSTLNITTDYLLGLKDSKINSIEQSRNLKILETEREQVKVRLENQISIARNTLEKLESKLKNGQELYILDGLQESGSNIDKCLAQLVTYDRSIELFKRELNKD